VGKAWEPEIIIVEQDQHPPLIRGIAAEHDMVGLDAAVGDAYLVHFSFDAGDKPGQFVENPWNTCCAEDELPERHAIDPIHEKDWVGGALDVGAMGYEFAGNDEGKVVVFFDVGKILVAGFQDRVIPMIAFDRDLFIS
jgi:hypothetical protein